MLNSNSSVHFLSTPLFLSIDDERKTAKQTIKTDAPQTPYTLHVVQHQLQIWSIVDNFLTVKQCLHTIITPSQTLWLHVLC